jgi:hypothetical protein
MHRRFAITIALSAVFMLAVLLLDRDGVIPQLLLGGAVAVFVWISSRGTNVPARQILWCVIVATTGEVVLSLGWGLYSYAHATIPFYVPPGHGLFYFLAAYTASQPFLRGKEAIITRAVIVGGSVIAAVSLFQHHDTWGCLWWAGALALIHVSQNQLMLAACFVYTIILEWAGTAIGNWRWAAHVPFVGLHSANPPAGVGILYILLDLIVVAICGAREIRRRSPSPTCLSASPSD